MKILITGGCGFIGSHLTDALLAAGHVVTILDNLSTGKREQANSHAMLVVGDVADATVVNRLMVDTQAVFHLAAVASVEKCAQDRPGSYRTNVVGSQVIFDAARGAKIPVIYASSAAVYGDNPKLPLEEDALTQPLSDYGRDKLAVEHYAVNAWKIYKIPSIGLRFFNVYGARQDPSSPYSGVISKFLDCVRQDRPITFFGDGEQTRDFIYVMDIVQLAMKALAHRPEGAAIYNGCTGSAVSLKQLAGSIGAVVDKPLVARHAAARVGDIRHSLGCPKKAAKDLGFRAEFSIDQGLRYFVGMGHA